MIIVQLVKTILVGGRCCNMFKFVNGTSVANFGTRHLTAWLLWNEQFMTEVNNASFHWVAHILSLWVIALIFCKPGLQSNRTLVYRRILQFLVDNSSQRPTTVIERSYISTLLFFIHNNTGSTRWHRVTWNCSVIVPGLDDTADYSNKQAPKRAGLYLTNNGRLFGFRFYLPQRRYFQFL